MKQKQLSNHSQSRFWLMVLLVSTVGIGGLTGCLVREEDHGHDHDHDRDHVIIEHDDHDHR